MDLAWKYSENLGAEEEARREAAIRHRAVGGVWHRDWPRPRGLPDGGHASGVGSRVFILEKGAECILLTSNSLSNSTLCLLIIDSLVRTAQNIFESVQFWLLWAWPLHQTSVTRNPEGPVGSPSPGKRPGSHYRSRWSASTSWILWKWSHPRVIHNGEGARCCWGRRGKLPPLRGAERTPHLTAEPHAPWQWREP